MPRAALFVFAALALFVAGCGGGKSAEPTTTTPSDLGREVMTAFVAAARSGDSETMWELMSEPSRRRYGPELEDFMTGEAKKLRKQLAPFAEGKLPVQVSENIDGLFGLVALSKGPHAYATPLRLEGGTWKVELPGRLKIDVSGPPPGSKGKFAKQIGVEVKGRSGGGTALLYLDGVTLFDPKIYSSPRTATVFAGLPNGVTPGRHTAVAFATSGNTAAATAWTFVP